MDLFGSSGQRCFLSTASALPALPSTSSRFLHTPFRRLGTAGLLCYLRVLIPVLLVISQGRLPFLHQVGLVCQELLSCFEGGSFSRNVLPDAGGGKESTRVGLLAEANRNQACSTGMPFWAGPSQCHNKTLNNGILLSLQMQTQGSHLTTICFQRLPYPCNQRKRLNVSFHLLVQGEAIFFVSLWCFRGHLFVGGLKDVIICKAC